MSRLDAIKARLGSIPHGKVRLIASVSPAAHKLLFDDLPKLIAIAEITIVCIEPRDDWFQLPSIQDRLDSALAALEEK